jgi:hypothetical protein
MTETRAWIEEEQHSLPGLLGRRLDHDPDGEYLDVLGVKFSAADVARDAGALAMSPLGAMYLQGLWEAAG